MRFLVSIIILLLLPTVLSTGENITSCHGIFSNDSRVCTNRQGECISLDTCDCYEGYHGYNCSIMECFDSFTNDTTGENCHARGECLEYPNKCECYEFVYQNESYFGGEDCERRVLNRWSHRYGKDVFDFGKGIIAIDDEESLVASMTSYISQTKSGVMLKINAADGRVERKVEFFHTMFTTINEVWFFRTGEDSDNYVAGGTIILGNGKNYIFYIGFNAITGVQNFAFTIGGGWHTLAAGMFQYPDYGDIVIVGRSEQWSPGTLSYAVMFRFQTDGTYVRGKNIGNSGGISHFYVGGGMIDSNEDVLLCGTYAEGSQGILFKLSSDMSSIIWGIAYWDSPGHAISSVTEGDGYYIFSGNQARANGKYMCFIGRVNATTGDYDWAKSIGKENDGDDRCEFDVIRLEDGNFVTVGTTTSYTGVANGWLIKFNEDGDILLAKMVNSTVKSSFSQVFESKKDGSMVTIGSSEENINRLSDAAIRRVDEKGDNCDMVDISHVVDTIAYNDALFGYWPTTGGYAMVSWDLAYGSLSIAHFTATIVVDDSFAWENHYEFCDCAGYRWDHPYACNFLNGSCSTDDGYCHCNENEGYYGEDCSTYICYGILGNYTDEVCSGNGDCGFIDQCDCDEGYLGDQCQYWGCPPGWHGQFCDILSCHDVLSNHTNPEDICLGRGNCLNEPNVCDCDEPENFFGDRCEKRMHKRFRHSTGKPLVSDVARHIVKTSDGKYLVSGTTTAGNNVVTFLAVCNEDGLLEDKIQSVWPVETFGLDHAEFVYLEESNSAIFVGFCWRYEPIPGWWPWSHYGTVWRVNLDTQETEWGYFFGHVEVNDYYEEITFAYNSTDILMVGMTYAYGQYDTGFFRYSEHGEYIYGKYIRNGRAWNYGMGVLAMKDGTTLISIDDKTPNKATLLKVSADGNTILWGKGYGVGPGGGGAYFTKFFELDDSIIVGGTQIRSTGYAICMFGRIWKNGTLSWIKLLGRDNNNHDKCITNLVRTRDGNFVFGGRLDTFHTISESAGLVFKFTEDGEVLWVKGVYWGTSESFEGIAESEDGGLILVGDTNKHYPTQYKDVLTRKLDEFGEGCDSEDIIGSISIFDFDGAYYDDVDDFVLNDLTEIGSVRRPIIPAVTDLNYFQTDISYCDCAGVGIYDSNVCEAHHGTCIDDDGKCDCNYGYHSVDCSITQCSNILSNQTDVCSSNGECVELNVCECDDEHQGSNCECPKHRVGGNCEFEECVDSYGNITTTCLLEFANCSINGTHCDCRMNETYFGSYCNITSCFGVNSNHPDVCTSMGVCVDYNRCDCEEDEGTEEDCSYHTCGGVKWTNSSYVCSNRGNCTAQDTCYCMAHYYEYNETVSCLHCPDGYYSGPGIVGLEECVECLHGTISLAINDVGCVECLPGEYELNNECNECPAGTYQPSVGQYGLDSCIPCPRGFWSETPRLVHMVQCSPCLRGTFSESLGSNSRGNCISCAATALCPTASAREFTPLSGNAEERIFSTSLENLIDEVDLSLKLVSMSIILFLGAMFASIICCFSICPDERIRKCLSFSRFDLFYDLKHDIDEGESPVKKSTCHGGLLSVVAVAVALILVVWSIMEFVVGNKISMSSTEFYIGGKDREIEGDMTFSVNLYGDFMTCTSMSLIEGFVFSHAQQWCDALYDSNNDQLGCTCSYHCTSCSVVDINDMFLDIYFDHESQYIHMVDYILALPHYREGSDDFIIQGSIYEENGTLDTSEVSLSLFLTEYIETSNWNLLLSPLGIDMKYNFSGIGASVLSTAKGVVESLAENEDRDFRFRFNLMLSNFKYIVEEYHPQSLLNFFAQLFALLGLAVGLLGVVFSCVDKFWNYKLKKNFLVKFVNKRVDFREISKAALGKLGKDGGDGNDEMNIEMDDKNVENLKDFQVDYGEDVKQDDSNKSISTYVNTEEESDNDDDSNDDNDDVNEPTDSGEDEDDVEKENDGEKDGNEG